MIKYEKPNLEELELLLEGSFLGCASQGLENGGELGENEDWD